MMFAYRRLSKDEVHVFFPNTMELIDSRCFIILKKSFPQIAHFHFVKCSEKVFAIPLLLKRPIVERNSLLRSNHQTHRLH